MRKFILLSWSPLAAAVVAMSAFAGEPPAPPTTSTEIPAGDAQIMAVDPVTGARRAPTAAELYSLQRTTPMLVGRGWSAPRTEADAAKTLFRTRDGGYGMHIPESLYQNVYMRIDGGGKAHVSHELPSASEVASPNSSQRAGEGERP
ncbi:MAG: post-PEP-CTERM-1 domain-containing protein [Lysobacter sp.]